MTSMGLCVALGSSPLHAYSVLSTNNPEKKMEQNLYRTNNMLLKSCRLKVFKLQTNITLNMFSLDLQHNQIRLKKKITACACT